MRRRQTTTFVETGFEACYKPTRREQYLTERDWMVPWQELCDLIEPLYPRNDGAGVLMMPILIP